ncbi:Protein KES1 [Serendipita indica DSM 11827]|uniref:Related to KES1-Member of an oxysterol-binding protein family n=1 Tax=Serendipita indica (strain DSM 11827) TaxID=1109443 RepID=G4TNH6_SERID|nr:Protein KES1 [Serendipita indica DSM 11827]CCA72869.1 related to KES1-Member of an oxysterol-binding protein family [Serendipita indica DSM 11827]
MSNQQEEGGAVPANQKSGWASFVKSIASFSGDLYSMTAPPFILSPVSLTEFPAYWLERPELFAAISDGVDAEDRALRVLKWFIATLKGQYTSRNEKMGSEKKPLNPVLGELFYGTWPDQNGRGLTKLLVEQVSHHPPITAYHITNESRNLTLSGHNAQKTSFSSGAILVKQVGHAILTYAPPGKDVEKYLITLPRLRIDGIWYGAPYIELTDNGYIQASTGYLSTIEYKGKGYFSGKAHSIKASFAVNPTSPIVVVEGQWDTVTKVTSVKGSKHAKTGETFTDVTTPKEEVTVAPIESQNEWETRKLWQNVANGIRSGDFEAASKDKTRIENEQRQRRKDEQAAGTPWQLKHFVHLDEDADYVSLAAMIKDTTNVLPTEDCYVFKPSSV